MEEKNKKTNPFWFFFIFLLILIGLVIIWIGVLKGKKESVPPIPFKPTPTPPPAITSVPEISPVEDSARESLKEIDSLEIPEFEEEFKTLDEEINSL